MNKHEVFEAGDARCGDGSNGRSRAGGIPRSIVDLLSVAGALALCILLADACGSACRATPPASPEAVASEELAGWVWVSTDLSEGEWLVSGTETSDAEPGSSPPVADAAAGEDGLGWTSVPGEGGGTEEVVASAVATAGRDDPIDLSQDGWDELNSGVPGAEAPAFRTSMIAARPEVVTEGATVRFTAAGSQPRSMQLRVVDVGGRVVYTGREESAQELSWDLRGDNGGALPRGVYYYTVHARGDDGVSIGKGRIVILGRAS